MVAANPFKKKDKPSLPDLDLTKIIEEEKTHNHTSEEFGEKGGITSNTSYTSLMKNQDKSPFIKKTDNNTNDKIVDINELTSEQPEAAKAVDTTKAPQPAETIEPQLPQRPTLDSLDDVDARSSDRSSSDFGGFEDASSSAQGFQPLPEFENNSVQANVVPRLPKQTKWYWRYRWPIIILVLVVIAIAAGFVVNQNLNQISLTISSSGLRVTHDKDANDNELDSELPVRVLAYDVDATSSQDLLYYLDTTATIKPDGTMNIAWDVPKEYASEETYNEFCVLDEARANTDVNSHCGGYLGTDRSFSNDTVAKFNRISCAYYIPSDVTGLSAFLSGRNNLGDDQQVGCAGSALENDTNFGDESYIGLADVTEDDVKQEDGNGETSNQTSESSNNNGLDEAQNVGDIDKPSTGVAPKKYHSN